MPEEEQRPGPRSEQTTVLSAPQPVDEPTAEDGTPANGLDPHTEQLAAGADQHTRPMTTPEPTAAAEPEPEAETPSADPAPRSDDKPAEQSDPAPQSAPEPPAAEAETSNRGKNAPPPNPPVQPEPLTRGLFAPIRPAEASQSYPSAAELTSPRGLPPQSLGAPRGTEAQGSGTQGPGTPPRGMEHQGQGFPAQGQGAPARGADGQGASPRGFEGQAAQARGPEAPAPGMQARDPEAQGPGTPPRGQETRGTGMPSRGLDTQGPGTPSRGLEAQGPGTPSRGAEAQGSGTPSRGSEAYASGMPSRSPEAHAPGTPSRGQEAPAPGTPPRGQETHALGTPSRGQEAQGSGTPPRGLEAQGPGTPPRGQAANGPGTPPRGFPGEAPGTPPRGFPRQGPGTPPRGFPNQSTPPRGFPSQPGTPPPGFDALNQGTGTPPRGFDNPAQGPGTPPRGQARPQGRNVDAPTQAIPGRSAEQPTRQIEQPTQSIPRPLGAGRQPDPEVDTVRIPKIGAATSFLPAPVPEEEATVVAALPPTPPGGDGDGFSDGADDERKSKRKRRTIMGVAAAFGVFGLLYGVDLLLSQGNVPRGVAVAGVDVGGLDRTAAEAKLRQQIEPRLTKPVTVRAGDVEASVNPQEAGLTLDWPATLDQAGAQPLNPLTRLSSFFGTRDVGVVTRADGPKLTSAMEGLRGKTDREPVEGTVRFQGAKPVPVDPKTGQKLDIEKASAAMVADWADGKVVELPVSASQVKSTPDSVRKALEEIAKPAVSGPVVVQGEGKNANLTPAAIASALKFEVDEGGNLTPKLDSAKVAEAAKPQLASTEKPGKDATFVIEGGKPVVKESVDGRGVDWEKTLTGLPEVLRRTDNRTIKAEYGDQPAKLTTEQANQLGIKEMISRFETKGFAPDSGQNIRRAAEQINGAVVKPGETFSLNARTGPRNESTGYVEAGILEHGLPGRGVGGGVSQMATTLYNAAYYAGMVDVEHKEHSNYISRYPAGREATVFQGPSGQSLIDVKFKNDTKTGIYIQTIWTNGSIAVQLWGTKTYEVQGQEGQRTNVTQPNTRHVTDKPDCKPSGGLEGFTITDTRTIKDLASGKTRTERRTVTYKAQDKIICGPPTP
ncbi:VanW family protein [Crossiella sp. SN42]|uniref:VanW family protein n=1 Tax=Crossiella sp. SN42 TaxID=2944808 RepID=UPI00207D3765|nr:VanW family protein [Crossiella sp. SN42]MCO1579627.1 VanW family protein [Crossiella sp. SN42]